jgi:hypothetical protein
VRTLEQIVEQIRAAAGADFAFVLSRKGRLCTRRAPQDMPEVGRNRIVRAARPLLGTDRVFEMTMAREELVPYGGAAPVDVYLGVVAEQAIVVVVLASWADRMRVAPAIESGMELIEPLLRRGLPVGRRSSPDLGPAKGSPYVPERASVLPPMLAPLPEVTRYVSAPDIVVGEAPLGRESMIAVHRDRLAGSSAPEISLGEAPLGRESLAAIDAEGKPRPISSPEAIRVELVSAPELAGELAPAAAGRATMPWVEPPADTKRAADAAKLGRGLAAPKVTIKLEEADEALGAKP